MSSSPFPNNVWHIYQWFPNSVCLGLIFRCILRLLKYSLEFFFKLRWANYYFFFKSISRWFLEIIEGAPEWHNPRPGNDCSKTMSLAISKCQVMLQMKRDKGRARRNTATKAAFQSCPHLLDHWCPQTRAADLLGVRRKNERVQHHRTRILPFSKNFSVASGSWVLEQDVTKVILLFPGRKGTPYTGLWFDVLSFKSSALFGK